MNKHSALASIHPNAKIGKNTTIAPFAVIEADVEIGDNCSIHSHAVVANGTRMGDNCQVFSGAIVGTIPQDLKFANEQTYLEIGNNVIIREYCTLNKGTAAHGKTVIKDNCLLMAYSHIAHDCLVGNNCIFANNASLGGHVEVGDFVRIGGLAAVHQFAKIGMHAFVAGGIMVRKDVPPYIKVGRESVSFIGVNSIGLQRAGYTPTQINRIKEMYSVLFVKKGYNTTKAVEYIKANIEDGEERKNILDFIAKSERGLVKGIR